MLIINKLSKLFCNKVFLYISSRYLTYLIQFISSIYIAVKLGAFYFGIYGFAMLLISYLAILNFGITHSTTVLLVQNKKNENEIKNIVYNAILIIFIITLFIILGSLFYYVFDINYFKKYDIKEIFYFIPLIAIVSHFNILFLTIYRFKNKLFEIAFQQSFKPFLVLISLFFSTEKNLLTIILLAFLIGEIVSLLMFLFRKQIPFGGEFSIYKCKEIFTKGFYLFLYISSISLLIISTRSFISYYYSVGDFGIFTFSYSLANALLLFLQAFTFIITPKILDKLNSKNNSQTILTIDNINVNYITFSYLLLFIAILIFPHFLKFFPEWEVALTTLNIVVISIMMFSNSYTYAAFLMAQHKEKLLSFIALISLAINVIVAYILIRFFDVEMQYVIISNMLSYFVFGVLCCFFTYKTLSDYELKKMFFIFFPLRLLIPYILLIVTIFNHIQSLIYLPFILFLIMNHKNLKLIILSINKVLYKSDLIDLK